jgi:putative hydrolase of the HAD superfamily
MQIKAIVFDFGRVVGFFDHRLTTLRLAAHSTLSADAIHGLLFGGPLEDTYESGRLSSAEFLRQVKDCCRVGCSEEMIAAAWADIFWPNEDVIRLLPGLKRHYRLLLGSNTNELHARQFCRQFEEVFAHFDALVLSHEVGARKPEASFFEHCRRLAACAPAECLFIDDLPANVLGARACGWHGIVYTGIADLRAELGRLGILGLESVESDAPRLEPDPPIR